MVLTGTEIVALAGLVSTAAVGLGAPLLAGRLERQRLRIERHQLSLDELRSVLDGAAIAVSAAQSAMWRTAHAAWDAAKADPNARAAFCEKAERELREFQLQSEQAWQFEDRLAVRIRGTSIWGAYHDAAEIVRDVCWECEEVEFKGWTVEACGQHLDMPRLGELEQQLRNAKRAYQDAASFMIGPGGVSG